jgi:hypothetical protein
MPNLPDNPYWESCDELTEGEGTVFEWDRKRPYTRRHLVKVKIEAMGPIDVALVGSAFPGVLPLPGSFYTAPAQIGNIQVPLEYDKLAIMIRQTAVRRSKDAGEWPWWIVTSEYGTEIPSRQSDPTSNQNDPSQDLADISWDFEEAQESRFHDLAGGAYVNSAFDPFLRPPITEVNYPVLNISRNEITYNFLTASYFSRSLNDDTFLGVPRGCVMCMPPKSVQRQRGVLYFWRTTYRLKFRPMQFNRTGKTDINELYRLPPLYVILPFTDGDGTKETDGDARSDNQPYFKNKFANCGNGGWEATGIFDDPPNDFLGQCRGAVRGDTNGNVRYVPSRGKTDGSNPMAPQSRLQITMGDKVIYPASKAEGGLPFTVRIWDSWQPLVLMEGLKTLRSDVPFFMGGPPTPNNMNTNSLHIPLPDKNLTHAVLINDWGQQSLAVEGVKIKDLTIPQRMKPPRPWYKQFINYRYTSMAKLLVKGLS